MTTSLPHKASVDMGFPPMTHVSTLLSISHLFGITSVRLKIKQNHLVVGWWCNSSGGVRLQGARNIGFLENRDRQYL